METFLKYIKFIVVTAAIITALLVGFAVYASISVAAGGNFNMVPLIFVVTSTILIVTLMVKAWTLSPGKRLGHIIALTIYALSLATMNQTTSYFDKETGAPTNWYEVLPDSSVVVHNEPGYSTTTGNKLKPINEEAASIIFKQKNSSAISSFYHQNRRTVILSFMIILGVILSNMQGILAAVKQSIGINQIMPVIYILLVGTLTLILIYAAK